MAMQPAPPVEAAAGGFPQAEPGIQRTPGAGMGPQAPAGNNPVIDSLQIIGQFAQTQQQQNPAIMQAFQALLQAMQGGEAPRQGPQIPQGVSEGEGPAQPVVTPENATQRMTPVL